MDLELEERRIYGKRYYTVTPLFAAHAPTWFKSEWEAILSWCVETYGPTPEDGVWTPGARWYANDAKFWFNNEQDLTVFMLRWT